MATNAGLGYQSAQVALWLSVNPGKGSKKVIAIPGLCFWLCAPFLLPAPVTAALRSAMTDRVTWANYGRISSAKTLGEVEAVLGPGMTAAQLKAFRKPAPERFFGHWPDFEESIEYLQGYGDTIADALLTDWHLYPWDENRYWISRRIGIAVRCDSSGGVRPGGLIHSFSDNDYRWRSERVRTCLKQWLGSAR
jgi:hypothetical protein